MTVGFNLWIAGECVRHPRIWGGVVVLRRRFNAWLRKRKQEPCDLEGFTGLLEDEGLRVIEVCGTKLVPGLGLKSDLEFYRNDRRRQREEHRGSTSDVHRTRTVQSSGLDQQ